MAKNNLVCSWPVRDHFSQVMLALNSLITRAVKEGVIKSGYLVGGAVRDLLLGKSPKDADILVECNCISDWANWLKKSPADEGIVQPAFLDESHNMYKFKIKLEDGTWEPELIESILPRGCEDDVLSGDAKHRDFTINQLYIDLTYIATDDDGENIVTHFIDPSGFGYKDLEDGIIRATDPEAVFEEDALRILRAIRFKHKLGFEIEENTWNHIKVTDKFMKINPVNFRSDLDKIMVSDTPVEAIKDLHERGLLYVIISELEDCWGYDQKNVNHSMTLEEHLFAVLDKVCKGMFYSTDLELRYAALFHDIAKPDVAGPKEDDPTQLCFHKHEARSAEKAEVIMSRLGFTVKSKNEISHIISKHMYFKEFDLVEAPNSFIVKKIRQFRGTFDNAEDVFVKCLMLIEADNESHAPSACIHGQVDLFLKRIDGLSRAEINQAKNKKFNLFNGKDLIKKTGIPSGWMVGELLKLAEEIQVKCPEISSEDCMDKVYSIYHEFIDIWVPSVNNGDNSRESWLEFYETLSQEEE